MASVGFSINIVGLIVITLATYFWGTAVFDIDLGSTPDWAVISEPNGD